MNGSNPTVMFHVALDTAGKLQPIITASIPFGNLELLQKLLSTHRVGGKTVDYNEKNGYLFMYDNNLSRPYPSVIIWRYEKRDAQSIIVDMGQEDLRAVQYAYENFLTPAKS